MIIIDGIEYRNLEEQVLKNKDDIEDIVNTNTVTEEQVLKNKEDIEVLKQSITSAGLTEQEVNQLIDNAAIKKDGSNTPTNDISWNTKGITELGFVEMNQKAAKPSIYTDIWKDTATNIHVTDILVTDLGLDCNNNQIINVGTPTNTNDAANKGYVDEAIAANNTDIENAIALKADKTALETLSGTVEGHTTAISEINSELDTKASAQSVTDLTAIVNSKADKATTLAGYGITDALPSSTKYAGSNSKGGSAISAAKLDTTTAGSTNQPVYFKDGKPEAITYTINKSVPSDAKFTDTTYTEATETSPGLMSSADKVKLDSISPGSSGGTADYANYVKITRPIDLFKTIENLSSETEAVYFYGSDGLGQGAPANYVIINAKKGSGGRTILDCYALQTGYHYINGCMNASPGSTSPWTGWILQPNNDTVGFTNKALTNDSGIYSTGSLQNEFSGNISYNQSARTIQYTTATTVQFIADVNGDNYITLNISGSLNLSATGTVHGFISGTKAGGGYVVNNIVGTYTSGSTSTITLYMPTGDTIAAGNISLTLFLGG